MNWQVQTFVYGRCVPGDKSPTLSMLFASRLGSPRQYSGKTRRCSEINIHLGIARISGRRCCGRRIFPIRTGAGDLEAASDNMKI